jgi:PAS domain S-box-containing protein
MSNIEEDKRNTFAQRIDVVNQRTQQLYQSARNMPWRQPELLIHCLEELWLALEELHVAEEELRQQNEEIVEARQHIEAERQRYLELFDFAPDGYLVTDLYGTMQEANQAAGRLLSITPNYLLGKPLANFILEEDRRSFRALLNQLPHINRVQDWEVQLRGRNEVVFDAALTVETVRDRHNQPIALRWLMRDITAHKQADTQLRQTQLQNLELIEADRLKTQFISMLSHELRTPLNAILGFSHVLRQRFQQQQNLQCMNMSERIIRNGKHLLTMIEDMLSFSRLKTHRLQLQPEPFDLCDLVNETVEDLRSLAEQKALELRLHLPPDGMPIVTDPLRMRQVLVNLVSNAIKFTDIGHGSIQVWDLPEERIIIAVSDTGMGIAPEHQSRIFQEFWQVNQTTTRQHSGTGLGLAISRAIVELMQGSISVESQLGQGSTFRVEVPRWLESSSLTPNSG